MNDDDIDSGGDFFVDMVKTIIGVGFVVLFVVTIGLVFWESIA